MISINKILIPNKLPTGGAINAIGRKANSIAANLDFHNNLLKLKNKIKT